MTATTYQAIAMIVYFVAMLAIGGWAYLRTDNFDDYMLADRDLNPWVAALSAGASDMSGWLLMGLPGTLYVSGLVEGWIAVGLTLGALANWLLVAPRLRAYTEVANNSITVPSFLDNRLHDTHRLLRWSSGLIILVYFTFYVSSGMVAGGRFLRVLLRNGLSPRHGHRRGHHRGLRRLIGGFLGRFLHRLRSRES